MATKPDELDPEVAGDQLFFILGAAASGTPLDGELRKILWRLLPFVKALREAGRDNPEQLRARWWKELHELGPFGFQYNPEEHGDV
jgi:hypothetical protein